MNPETRPTLNNANLSLAVLSITAVMFLIAISNRSAMATGQTDRGGDYIMLGMQHRKGLEHVVITDAAARRMAVYALNRTTHRLEKWSQFDLSRMTELRRQGGTKPGRRGR